MNLFRLIWKSSKDSKLNNWINHKTKLKNNNWDYIQIRLHFSVPNFMIKN